MLRLDLPTEPFWLDLVHGVRVRVRPLTAAEWFAAKGRNVEILKKVLEERAEIQQMGGKVEGLPDLSDEAAQLGYSQALFATALAQTAIFAWEGVGEDLEHPAECTKDNIARLMRFSTVAEDFLVQYAAQYDRLVEEGEGSPAAARGTSAAGRGTAKRAGKKSSRARKGKSAKTDTDAPTSSTNRKPTKDGSVGT